MRQDCQITWNMCVCLCVSQEDAHTRSNTKTSPFGQRQRSPVRWGQQPCQYFSPSHFTEQHALSLPEASTSPLRGLVSDHSPSMGVLLSGRFAKTTSTYSSCILWREPFKPEGRGEKKLRKTETVNSQFSTGKRFPHLLLHFTLLKAAKLQRFSTVFP